MRVRITPLRFWKSEHTSIEKCEDALACRPEHGLFVVADGAGTAAYANIWSQLLVDRYITCPLLSNDPFEVEWWLAEPQRQFVSDSRIPKEIDQRNWQEQKTRDLGSQSTLATVRVRTITSDMAKADLLVFGDSCVMRGRSGQVDPFPLTTEAEFDANPICLPSRAKLYSRKFHQAEVRELDLQPGDTLLLATDAVSKWIIGCGDKYGPIWDAFRAVTAIRDDERWREAVLAWRTGPRAMRDDDSTALIVEVYADSEEGGQPLGATDGPDDLSDRYEKCLGSRREEFERAKDNKDRKQMAIVYGDGQMLRAAGITLADDKRSEARQVADAWKEVFDATQRKLDFESNKAGTTDIDLESVWRDNRDKLRHEPSAGGLINTLTGLGIQMDDRPATNAPNGPSVTRPMNSASRNEAVAPLQDPTAGRGAQEARTPPEVLGQQQTSPAPSRSLSSLRDELRRVLDNNSDKHITGFYIINQKDIDAIDDLSIVEKERIEAAIAREDFRAALNSKDDEKIVKIYEKYHDILDRFNKVVQSEKDYYRSARERLEALDHFRRAIQNNDEQQIVLQYDINTTLLDGYSKVTSEQRIRLVEARKCVEMPKLVRKAIESDEDAAIVRAYDPNLIRQFTNFTPDEEQRIQLARDRVRKERKLQRMLEQDDQIAITQTFRQYADLFKDVSTSELLARLPSEQAGRITEALERDSAYQRLCSAIAANNDEQIIAAYVPMLHDYPAVTDSDRARVAWAEQLIAFVEASERSQIDEDEDVKSKYDSSFEEYTPGEQVLAGRFYKARARLREARSRGEFITSLRAALDKGDYVFIVQHTGEILDLFERNDPRLRQEDRSKLSKVYSQLGALAQFWNGVINNKPEDIVNGYRSAQEFGMPYTMANDERYKKAIGDLELTRKRWFRK